VKIYVLKSKNMISFEEAKKLLRQHLGDYSDLVIPTLGERSEIRVYLYNGLIFFRNSRDNAHEINQAKWDAVYERRQQLPQHLKNRTSQYGNPIWDTMPRFLNHITAPYIPAIMRFLEDPDNYTVEPINVDPNSPDPRVNNDLFPDKEDIYEYAYAKLLRGR
jgi:hypothetical protein